MTSSNTSVELDPAKDALLARLTTEVRHALHQVLGNLELVSEHPLSGSQGESLARCRESAHDLLRIANDVSELAYTGPCRENRSQFEIAEMLSDFSSLIRPRAERKGLELHGNVDRRIPNAVVGDRQALEMVLYRLVDNSIRFTSSGEIALRARMTSEGIGPGDRGAAEIVIEVSDSGPGIPPRVLEDLKGPVEEAQGRGLGLRLVRKHLAEIGGHLDVVCSDAHGTTLAVVFPVTIPSAEQTGESGSEDRPRADQLRVLIAEDSDDSFAVFEAFVKDEGHTLTRAVNGAEAVRLFKRETFDVVVMDANMPVVDGYTATAMIREWETVQGRARLPILLLSADDPSRQMRIGSAVGCSGYLTKPTPKRELLYALRHYGRFAA